MVLYRWYRTSTASTHRERRQYAIRNIRYYYSHVVNGVSAIIYYYLLLIIIMPITTSTKPAGANIAETQPSVYRCNSTSFSNSYVLELEGYTAFPLPRAMGGRSNKNIVSLLSSVMSVMHLPSSTVCVTYFMFPVI